MPDGMDIPNPSFDRESGEERNPCRMEYQIRYQEQRTTSMEMIGCSYRSSSESQRNIKSKNQQIIKKMRRMRIKIIMIKYQNQSVAPNSWPPPRRVNTSILLYRWYYIWYSLSVSVCNLCSTHVSGPNPSNFGVLRIVGISFPFLSFPLLFFPFFPFCPFFPFFQASFFHLSPV